MKTRVVDHLTLNHTHTQSHTAVITGQHVHIRAVNVGLHVPNGSIEYPKNNVKDYANC